MTTEEFYTSTTTGFVEFRWATEAGGTYPDESTWYFMFTYWFFGMLWIVQV